MIRQFHNDFFLLRPDAMYLDSLLSPRRRGDWLLRQHGLTPVHLHQNAIADKEQST